MELDTHGEAALPEGRDRWLLSYADLLTLLFALFVVLFASAYGRKMEVKAPLVLKQAPSQPKPLPAPAITAPAKELSKVNELLQRQLEQAIQSGKVETRFESRGLVIELSEASFFLPGDDRMQPETRASLGEIARAVGTLPNRIAVEGHADSAVIHNSRFTDNWELSAARSLAVVRYLTHELQISPNRISAAAYAETRPRSDNSSPSGRARNRRVDIVVLGEPEVEN